MSSYSKINIIYRLQKWLDSVPGQTFLNYAYSWGAAVVILGALFKLTHISGADTMLFLGMGTEVIVFFLSGFDRPFNKTEIGKELPIHYEEGMEGEETDPNKVVITEYSPINQPQVAYSGPAYSAPTNVVTNNTTINTDNTFEAGETVTTEGTTQTPVVNPVVSNLVPDGTIVTGGPQVVYVGSGNVSGASASAATNEAPTTTNSVPAVEQSATPTQVSAPTTSTEPQDIASSGIAGTAAAVSPAFSIEVANATGNYIEQLQVLTETLQKVSEQSQRLTRDSEEMENLNRTLTGISRVYEMQLKGASQQIGTIDEINAQTKHMAEQIAELNQIYARMIEAMTTNAAIRGGQQ